MCKLDWKSLSACSANYNCYTCTNLKDKVSITNMQNVITKIGAEQAIGQASQLPIMQANCFAVSATVSSPGHGVAYPGRGKKAGADEDSADNCPSARTVH